MRKYASLLLSLILLASCEGPPKLEQCYIEYNTVFCIDDRIDDPPMGCTRVSSGSYECPLAYGVGYSCTNPNDLKEHMKYDDDMIKDLRDCKRALRR